MTIARGAVIAFCLGALSLGAGEIRLNTLYRTGTLTKNVAAANVVIRDVVGDSKPEIVSCAGNSSVFAASYDGTTFRDVWYSPHIGCVAVTVADRDGNGVNDVLAAGATNTDPYYYNPAPPSYLYAFDPTSYGPAVAKVQVSATEVVNDVAAGNVDGDADLEVVAVTNTKAYVFNAATFALEWTAPWGGHTVAIADLENDGQNEIIIAGTDGTVLNAYTQTFKWGYAGGFGTCMAVGDVDNDGKPEIVGGKDYTSGIKIINGDTMTTVTVSSPQQVQAITTGDANNDGQIEMIVGNPYWGAVEGYNIAGTKLWSISNPEYGVMGMTVGDPDTDGKNEILWGAGFASTGADVLLFGNANAQNIKYRTVDLDAPFKKAIADLDGDGDLELIVATKSTDSGYKYAVVNIYDYATRQLTGKISTDLYAVYDLAVGQVDADAAREIVLLGYNTIVAYDGITLAKQWTSPFNSSNSAPAQFGFMVRNIDADPVDEIIYSTAEKKIVVLNGAGEFTQYTTGVLDNFVTDVDIADLDGDSVPDLAVATYTGAYVFRTSDWLQRTYIPLTNQERRIAATPGHFAVNLYGSGLAIYSGGALTQEWACTSGNPLTDLAFVTLAGQQRLTAAMTDSTLRLFPLGGATCPAYDTMSQVVLAPLTSLTISFADVDGDGRPELVTGGGNVSVSVLGWASEPRGDVNLDGLVTDADIDALAAYFYGTPAATQPAADVNGDGAVRPDDLYYLINYRRGTGAPPPL